MPDIQRVLAPTDFSAAADTAFQYALDLAARQHASLHLLHVVEESMRITGYPDGFYVEHFPGRAEAIADASRRLEVMRDACVAAHVTSTIEVVVGRPSRTIADIAASRRIDLIVMGTHGRSGVAHFALGSVADRVLRVAPCPVLTVRQPASTTSPPPDGAPPRRPATPS